MDRVAARAAVLRYSFGCSYVQAPHLLLDRRVGRRLVRISSVGVEVRNASTADESCCRLLMKCKQPVAHATDTHARGARGASFKFVATVAT